MLNLMTNIFKSDSPVVAIFTREGCNYILMPWFIGAWW